jgi:delta 1-pyrroline-5-carboxylate dehydrogenase
VGVTLDEIGVKFDENETLLESRKKKFWEKFKRLIQQMMNKEPDPIIYDLEYGDGARGTTVREKVNYHTFREEINRKARSMTAVGARGSAAARLEGMQEDQLFAFLAKAIRDIQSLHRTLSALDDFFKTAVDHEDREKIRGIKPELAAIKNAIVRANQKRYEYTARKEEEEQMKRLGINLES